MTLILISNNYIKILIIIIIKLNKLIARNYLNNLMKNVNIKKTKIMIKNFF